MRDKRTGVMRTLRGLLIIFAIGLASLMILARTSNPIALYVKRLTENGLDRKSSPIGSLPSLSAMKKSILRSEVAGDRSATSLNTRDLTVETKTVAASASQVGIAIDYEAAGTEFGFAFSVNYNKTHLQYDSATLGGTIPGWTVLTNDSGALTNGNLVFGLSGDLNTLASLPAGNTRLMVLTFNILPAAKCGVISPITVSGLPSAPVIADSTGNALTSPTVVAGGVTVTPIPITFTTSSTLIPGSIGTSYSQSITASGGSGTFTNYIVTAGALPAGLSLSTTGTIAGTPTASGTFSVTVKATDSNGCTGTQTFSLTVSCPSLSLNPTSLPVGTQFSAYPAQTFTTTGATGTVTYSISSGSLPAGLTLNASSGLLSGTPNVNGVFNFTVRATDSNGCSASRPYSFTINCPTIMMGALPNGIAGNGYSGSTAVSSPAGSYSYTVTSGSLPPGLSLNTTSGSITGVPTTIGSSTFTVTATGLGSCSGTRTYTIEIACPTIIFTPLTLPTAITKIPYSQTVTATPGGSYVYSVTNGSLPSGLAINSSSGLLSGIPTTPGTFNFSITATGWGGCSGTLTATIDVVETNVPPVTGDPATPILPTPNLGPGGVVTLTQTLTNNIPFSFSTTFSATLPDGLNVLPGGCTVPFGVCSITPTPARTNSGNLDLVYQKYSAAARQANQSLTWSGTIPANSSITITYLVQVGSQAVSGTQYCITTTIGANAGPSTCLTVTVPQSGPGVPLATAGSATQQKPGSVLIYNIYTSTINTSQSDTRITLTNINAVNPVFVHLFFVDGSNCTVADQFVSLTQNQTVSFQMSDIDPGVTGYIVAVATDSLGCPVIHNDLIGESFVKFESGHKADLPAIGVSGLTAGSPLCTPNSVTTTLSFDGLQYNLLPRTLAIDSLAPPATANSSMLIVNRLGGDMTAGAQTLGTIVGLLFDDLEVSQSFTLPGGTCQVRGILGNNLPRTVPRYTSVIPAGRTGWMKFSVNEDQAITGAVINQSTYGFSGGHNLHNLTTTSSASLTIPVFPPR